MKAFSLFKTYYSNIEEQVIKVSVWTEVLKKDLVSLLDDIEKKTDCGCRINETTLLQHCSSENKVITMDFVYTIEEVTIK